MVACAGDQAFKRALAHPPDVVLVDSTAPDLDGPALACLLRSDERTRHALLCTLSGEEDRRCLLDAGWDLHLARPLDHAELRALLAAARKIALL
jgi:two-component system KDP operon response regulator KdpE